MNPTSHSVVLRANAAFLLIASTFGMCADLAGAFPGVGPQQPILRAAPHAAIGFVEAHGLAFIVGVLLWRAESTRLWHLTAAAVHVLLGTANLAFWQIFVAADALWLGNLTTVLHWTFVVLQLRAAINVSSGAHQRLEIDPVGPGPSRAAARVLR